MSHAITSLDRRNAQIIKEYNEGAKVVDIARKYDISTSRVHVIIARCKKRQINTPTSTIAAVLDLHRKNYKQNAIARMLGLSRQLVSRIIIRNNSKKGDSK
jgi:DNA-binding transcriptional regulator LsrR (DeoR family)